MRLVKTKKNFRKEFKRQLRYAIAAAVGFIIIYAWKESILDMTNNIVEKIQETTSVASSDIASALIITIVGVLIIVISAKILKDR